MSANEDEAHVIYLVALDCSQKLEMLGSCFYLILQLLYNEEIIHEQAILDWISSARDRIANADSQEADAKPAAAGEDSYGEEGAEDDIGEPTVSIEAM